MTVIAQTVKEEKKAIVIDKYSGSGITTTSENKCVPKSQIFLNAIPPRRNPSSINHCQQNANMYQERLI